MDNELRKQLFDRMGRLANELVTDPEKIDDFARKWRNGFHSYSWGNLLLIAFQRPSATLCAGYKQWPHWNRYVQRGEKGVAVLAPMFVHPRKADGELNEDETVLRFRIVYVFDVSQTAGEELDLGHSDMVKGSTEYQLADIAALFPKYQLKITQPTEENGSTDGKHISVSQRPNQSSMIATYFHELGHAMLHYDGKGEHVQDIDTNTRELEAEAVGYITAASLGIENERSRVYIAGWHGDKEKLGKSGARIVRTAEKILRTILDTKAQIAA